MEKQVIVKYGPNGEIRVEAIGFEGEGCKAATAAIEAALGESTDIEYKAEWWALNGSDISDFDENLCG